MWRFQVEVYGYFLVWTNTTCFFQFWNYLASGSFPLCDNISEFVVCFWGGKGNKRKKDKNKKINEQYLLFLSSVSNLSKLPWFEKEIMEKATILSVLRMYIYILFPYMHNTLSHHA